MNGSVVPGWKGARGNAAVPQTTAFSKLLSPGYRAPQKASLRGDTPRSCSWAGQGCWEWSWLLGGCVSLTAAGSKKLLDPFLSVEDGDVDSISSHWAEPSLKERKTSGAVAVPLRHSHLLPFVPL